MTAILNDLIAIAREVPITPRKLLPAMNIGIVLIDYHNNDTVKFHKVAEKLKLT